MSRIQCIVFELCKKTLGQYPDYVKVVSKVFEKCKGYMDSIRKEKPLLYAMLTATRAFTLRSARRRVSAAVLAGE
eukprot:5005431-Pleurochrysis_carterae.AAC.1